MAKALYKAIYEDLKQSIFTGVYRPGDMIPSENELAAKYATSRVTIRHSLNMLENERMVRSWHGKGYFVMDPEYDSFTLTFSEHGQELVPRPHNITLITPDDEVRMALQLQPQQRVVAIRRVMLYRDVKAVYDVKYLPYVKGMPLVETEIRYADFPALVANKTSPYAISTQMEIGWEYLPADVAEKLDVTAGVPSLVIYRFLTDEKGYRVGFGKRHMLSVCGRVIAYSGFDRRPNGR